MRGNEASCEAMGRVSGDDACVQGNVACGMMLKRCSVKQVFVLWGVAGDLVEVRVG